MKTKFNRKDVSRWCKWIAVDKDGACWEYPTKPVIYCESGVWSLPTLYLKVRFLYKGEPPKNWKDELYTWE